MRLMSVFLFCLLALTSSMTTPQSDDYKGREFRGIADFADWTDKTAGRASVLTSPTYPVNVAADEIVVSWNAETPAGTGITIEAQAEKSNGKFTKWYVMGKWSQDGIGFPRESVNGQKDDDGNVATDTLILKSPPKSLRLSITRHATPEGKFPAVKFVGLSFANTKVATNTQEPNRAAWGKEIVVPSRTQSGWKDASGWCSPTSTSMALAFWGAKTQKPEWDVPVPDAAKACFDKVYDGTGNWAFNTAWAGSFPGVRAYVTRLSDIRELEDWTLAGLPVVVSVSYDWLKGMKRPVDPGHLLVCVGFTANGDIVLNDPAHHPERGETARRVYPRANFLKAWSKSKNTVYLIYPEGTSLPSDPLHHWDSSLKNSH